MANAPGPNGGLIWGSLQPFKADAIGFLAQAIKNHGPIVRFRFGPITVHILNAPEYIDYVLSQNAPNFNKVTRSASRIAATTGDSLLSANLEAWSRHRHLIQPAFQPKCFDKNCDAAIDALLHPAMERWQRQGVINIVDEMMQLVIGAAIRILFSTDIEPKSISNPLDILLADTWRRIEAPLDASIVSSYFHRRAFKKALAEIDAVVFDLISKRSALSNRPDDVLSRLLIAHETEGAQRLSNRELRDAAITLLLAGHETTANALAWAFIHAADGHENAEPQHIFAEALRLHPSIWVIERRAVQDDVIGGYQIPKNSSVLISPYLLHRDSTLWPDPDTFDPDRFAGDTPHPRHVYLPFGLGQHRCIGLYLARKMANRVITTVFQHFHLRLLPGQTLGAVPGITLRHRSAVAMAATRKI